MQYLLDTNTCIQLIKHHPPEFWRKLSVIPVGQVGLSSCVLAELCGTASNNRHYGRKTRRP